MKEKAFKYKQIVSPMNEHFDPNGPGLKNNNFIGLPFDLERANLVLLPVPWDVTVSYQAGTSTGPENIRQASTQLDLMHPIAPQAWKKGIYFAPENIYWRKRNEELRPKAKSYINFIESGGKIAAQKAMQNILEEVNYSCTSLCNWVEAETTALLQQDKIIGLIGGDHSSPLGYLKALGKQYPSFGILQIDAHMDLRAAYEGFTYSHASIFHNVMSLTSVSKLVQVGIRDYCQAEWEYVQQHSNKVEVFFDTTLKENQFKGLNWHQQCMQIIASLPDLVYISFDIDGLEVSYCPNTGTPVPGGLSFEQACYLLTQLHHSGKKIIGFDICEVAGSGHEWDANVGARMTYHLSCLSILSKFGST